MSLRRIVVQRNGALSCRLQRGGRVPRGALSVVEPRKNPVLVDHAEELDNLAGLGPDARAALGALCECMLQVGARYGRM